MTLTEKQLDKLTSITLDVGKAVIIAALVSPVINSALELLVIIRTMLTGFIIIYAGLTNYK